MSAVAQAAPGRPSHVRYGALAFAGSLSMITYMDRVAIAAAAPALVAALHLQSVGDLKWVFSAFALAYGLFEVPSGWMGSVFGPKKTLIRIVLWWSLFTALTGLVGLSIGSFVFSLGFLVVVRFLFGAGEAGAYPNLAGALHGWFPVQERGLAQGALWFCGKFMGGLTPLIWTLLVAGAAPIMSWRGVFYLFGATGIIWCVAFAVLYRNRPEDHPRVNAAELALIRGADSAPQEHRKIPWRHILLSRNLWPLYLMYACQSYGWFFNVTYLPQFLEQQYDVPAGSFIGALYKGGPLWLGAFGCIIGGLITDAFIRRTGNRRWGRRICGLFGHSLCFFLFLLCPHASSAFLFFLAVSIAAFATDLMVASSWAICQDVGGRHTPIIGAVMNMLAQLGNVVAAVVTGKILQLALDRHAVGLGVTVNALSPAEKAAGLLPGYHLNFYIYAFFYLVAVLCWLKIDATKPVISDSSTTQ